MAMSFWVVSSLHESMSRRRVRWVMLQNKNKMQVAESNALMMFTMKATFDGSPASWVNRLAVSMKNGAPGGWPTSSL